MVGPHLRQERRSVVTGIPFDLGNRQAIQLGGTRGCVEGHIDIQGHPLAQILADQGDAGEGVPEFGLQAAAVERIDRLQPIFRFMIDTRHLAGGWDAILNGAILAGLVFHFQE